MQLAVAVEASIPGKEAPRNGWFAAAKTQIATRTLLIASRDFRGWQGIRNRFLFLLAHHTGLTQRLQWAGTRLGQRTGKQLGSPASREN
ncbi:MAG: hypothetical protein ACK49R_18850 [Planctomycetota bacterium]|jgi:hypothetical protein|nr:hypothetical protein [Blastopirellula sp.]